LAPENTLAAFKLGADYGYTMFECDVKLSSDNVPFLLHDAELERTTNGIGIAGLKPWSELQKLDAGAWHSSQFKGEGIPTLSEIAQFCIANNYDLNIEIKPTPGHDDETGRIVAQYAEKLWASHPKKPLLTSFSVASLTSAKEVAPKLAIGLLAHNWEVDTLISAKTLGCQVLVCHYDVWTSERITSAKQLGLKTLSYTVNQNEVVGRLHGMGVDGIITDRVDIFPSNRL